MASYQRVALFIFFDAIEKDLVLNIRSIENFLEESFLSPQERDKAIRRLKDGEIEEANFVQDLDLLHHLDLGDKISAVQRNIKKFASDFKNHFSSKLQSLQASVSIRNAVMHGRPLTVTEHAIAFALANDLVKNKTFWPNLQKQILDYNEDPEAIARNAVSFLEDADDPSIFHNLPIPDYDDTGFVPRPNLERELRQKLLGRHPVVTVLGDGGNGKTAIALQSLYGLLNSQDHDFEAIVWVSAKSAILTSGEIKRIENAIITSMGMFEYIAGVFGDSGEDPMSNVKHLLKENCVLLVIDNLETVLDKTIQEFVSDVPGRSKILLTSRVPVGGDLTVSVGPLTETESEVYLRALIKAYGVSALAHKKPEELRAYAVRLGNKPLLLKWFALGVQSGLSPARIVANPELALRFCLENVFDALGDNAKTALSLISILPRPVSLGVLAYVSQVNVVELEAGIAELLRFTIIEIESLDTGETNYKMKPFARAYVNRVLAIAPLNRDEVLSKFLGLSSTFQVERGAGGRDKYQARNYTVRSISEAVAVPLLRNAVRLAMSEDYTAANKIIENAKISHPDYFEVYRADATIKLKQNDPIGAKQSYETAVELAGDLPQIHYFFGGFMLRAFSDCGAAIDCLEAAREFDPTSTDIRRELARAKMYDHDYSSAELILSELVEDSFSNLRSKLIFSDLRVQNFERMISHLAAVGIEADLGQPISNFLNFLRDFDSEIIDDTMLRHLNKTRQALDHILSKSRVGEELLTELGGLIRSMNSKELDVPDSSSQVLHTGVLGSLKEQGRKPNFGFLVDALGREAFLPRESIGSMLWDDLSSGAIVKYDIIADALGRNKAANVIIHKIPPLLSDK